MSIGAGNQRFRDRRSRNVLHRHHDRNVAIRPCIGEGTAVSVIRLGPPAFNCRDTVQTILLENSLNDESGRIADRIAAQGVLDLSVYKLTERIDVKRGQRLNCRGLHCADRTQIGVRGFKRRLAVLRRNQKRAIAHTDLGISGCNNRHITDRAGAGDSGHREAIIVVIELICDTGTDGIPRAGSCTAEKLKIIDLG